MLTIYTTIASRLAALRKDEKGVTALEYGIIAAAVIVTGLASFSEIGPRLAGVFTSIRGNLPAAPAAAP